MTKDEIIKLATEAGLCYPSNGFVDWIDAGPSLPELTFFASLVAEQEIEKCARVCDKLDKKLWEETGEPMSGYGEAIRKRS
jgi:hypothetical protein